MHMQKNTPQEILFREICTTGCRRMSVFFKQSHASSSVLVLCTAERSVTVQLLHSFLE